MHSPRLPLCWPRREEAFPVMTLSIQSHQGGHGWAQSIPFTPGASLLPWLFIIPLLLPLPSGSQMFLKKKGHRASRTLRRQACQIGEHRFYNTWDFEAHACSQAARLGVCQCRAWSTDSTTGCHTANGVLFCPLSNAALSVKFLCTSAL